MKVCMQRYTLVYLRVLSDLIANTDSQFPAKLSMLMSVEHERLVRMIKESITLMCKSSLTYELELNVEGLLGITLDKKDVVLVNINESFQTELAKKPPTPEPPSPGRKRTRESGVEIKAEDDIPSGTRKRRARRRSKDSQGEKIM